MIVVSAKDLTKAYGTDVILDKVSFHINKGERVGIIGVNGAGKTTLLKILTGEMPCEEGDFHFVGYQHRISEAGRGIRFRKDSYRRKLRAYFSAFHRWKRISGKTAGPHERLASAGPEGEGKATDCYDMMQEKFQRFRRVYI